MEIIRNAAEPTCAQHLENSINTIDALLGTPLRDPLKALFGLADLEHDEDFVSVLEASKTHRLDCRTYCSIDFIAEPPRVLAGEKLGP